MNFFKTKTVDTETATQESGEATAGRREESQPDIDVPDALNAETHDANTHDTHTNDAEPPMSDAITPNEPVEPNTVTAATPECNQDMQLDDEPLNLSIKNNVDSPFGVIDLKSGALDLSLKK